MVSAARLCLICKGSRALCGLKRCPLLGKIEVLPKIEKSVGKEFFGPSTSVFVGRMEYPNVFVGPMSSITGENLNIIDNPSYWFGMEYEKIIGLRSMLLRSKQKENIYSKSRTVEQIQELAIAEKPTDVEIVFKKKPSYRFRFSDIVQPIGPSAFLEKLKIAENPRISNITYKILSDEIKASEAVAMFYKYGKDVYKISTIFSSGVLGIEKRMVPTRWSITAIDDMIFKNLVEDVKNYPHINEYRVYSSEYLSNHFEILLIPGNWEYENFEAWAPGTIWTSQLKKPEIIEEYENYSGRKEYAEKEGGGYYAARLGVIEALAGMKKQAKVVVFREVYEGYVIPLGVWVVRETVRNTFKNKYEKFEKIEDALNFIRKRLRIDINDYIKKSKILGQKRIFNFLNLKN